MEHWNIGFFKKEFFPIIPLFHFSRLGGFEGGVNGTVISPKI